MSLNQRNILKLFLLKWRYEFEEGTDWYYGTFRKTNPSCIALYRASITEYFVTLAMYKLEKWLQPFFWVWTLWRCRCRKILKIKWRITDQGKNKDILKLLHIWLKLDLMLPKQIEDCQHRGDSHLIKTRNTFLFHALLPS